MNNTLPEGTTLEQLQSNWDTAVVAHTTAFRRIRLLDAADRGRIWDALRAKFPQYQLLPDTNHVSYVKENIMASLYTVGKSAQLLPTTEEDKQVIGQINIQLQHYWDKNRIGHLQLRAGERAALTNLCPVQVGWDKAKNEPVCKRVDPTRFMRDPYSIDLDHAGYCMTWELLHKNLIAGHPLYKDSFAAADAQANGNLSATPVELHRDRPSDSEVASNEQYRRVVIHWVRTATGIHEIHTLDSRAVLHVKENIKPNRFPFALLYCNEPADDLIGTSAPARVFSNSVAYNIINSLVLTAEYKNQRPPRFVNSQAGLNLASFIKHGNDADYTFIVNGDARQAVHYHQFPTPSANAGVVMQSLGRDIQQVSGVDGRYTGRDTGSIITTGGVESMLDQVSQVDMPKILNYEQFTCDLSRLIVENFCEFGGNRSYFVKDPKTFKTQVVTVNYQKLDPKTLSQYSVSISSELPKNKARLAQMANTLMEKQMQYAQSGQRVEFITPEEWLMFQDLPVRELMQERMGIQRNQDYLESVSKILFHYATLTRNGMPPDEAMYATAEYMQNDAMGGGGQDVMMPEGPVDLSAGAPIQSY